MKIAGGNSFFNAAMAGLTDSKSMSKKVLQAQMTQDKASLDQASADLAVQLSGVGTGYEMAQENVALDGIWLQARDGGLGEQTEMALEARDAAMRGANEATVTDAQRKSLDAEIKDMAAETTRIGMANNVNGSHTLARSKEVRTIEEITKEIEVDDQTTSETRPQIDVLWVVDRTGSMGDDIDHIRQDAPKMFKDLQDKGYDVRMAIESFETDLDNRGSTDFKSDAVSFQADVNSVLGNIGGGVERGLNSLEQAIGRFGGKFNPDATKVTILLSDEYSDDFYVEENWWKTGELAPGAGAEQSRQHLADSLKSVDSELYVVGIDAYNPSDKDYTDVIDKMGKGAAIKMDRQGKWVDEVTKNFIASAEKNVVHTKSKKTVTETVVHTETKLQGDWDLTFQVGPGADEHLTERFKTSTAETSGLSKAGAGTAEEAQKALDVIDGALDFLGNNRTQAGALHNRFTAIEQDLATRSQTPQERLTASTDAFNPRVSTSLWGLLSAHLKMK